LLESFLDSLQLLELARTPWMMERAMKVATVAVENCILFWMVIDSLLFCEILDL
jgi:hypothetical protein